MTTTHLPAMAFTRVFVALLLLLAAHETAALGALSAPSMKISTADAPALQHADSPSTNNSPGVTVVNAMSSRSGIQQHHRKLQQNIDPLSQPLNIVGCAEDTTQYPYSTFGQVSSDTSEGRVTCGAVLVAPDVIYVTSVCIDPAFDNLTSFLFETGGSFCSQRSSAYAKAGAVSSFFSNAADAFVRLNASFPAYFTHLSGLGSESILPDQPILNVADYSGESPMTCLLDSVAGDCTYSRLGCFMQPCVMTKRGASDCCG